MVSFMVSREYFSRGSNSRYEKDAKSCCAKPLDRHGLIGTWAGREVHSAQQILETRVGAQWVEERLNVHESHPGRASLIRFFQPLDRTVLIEPRVSDRQVKRIDIFALGQSCQFFNQLEGLLLPARRRIEIGQMRLVVAGFRQLFIFGKRFGIHPFGRITPKKLQPCWGSVAIEFQSLLVLSGGLVIAV